MPSFPRARWLAGGLLLAAVAGGRLPEWVRHIEAGSALESIFFADRPTPGGTVPARRLPDETRSMLAEAITARPDETELYRLRALESERALDFIAAESDWREYAARVDDPADGRLALADFYAERLRPADEVDSLLAVGRSPDPPGDELRPVVERRSWTAFERALGAVDLHALGDDLRLEVLAAWVTRYPEERAVYERRFVGLLEAGRVDAAQSLIDDYAAAFPSDRYSRVSMTARLVAAVDGDDAAVAFYEEAFEPLWPQPLVDEFFARLERQGLLRERLDEARARRAADPNDLEPAAWIFHYRRRQGDRAAAVSELSRYLASLESPAAVQLETLGRLFRGENAANDAARCFQALYSAPGATSEHRETALAELASLLLDQPEQPIRFGEEDLSFYRDVATLDPHPGFLNGVLSLVLNSQGLDWNFDNQDNQARAYFRRAKALELIDRLDRDFPSSDRRAALRAKAVGVLAVYGDSEAVIRRGESFLADFPQAYQRSEVSLRIAEALARTGQTDRELETYDRLLEELAERFDGVPLGPGTVSDQLGRPRYGPGAGPRSPDYARVLDRYVARLAALDRSPDAIRLYMREINRNPDDPGLYARLAGYLDANGLLDGVEGVYRQAIARFDETSWQHKLARWYIRRQRTTDVQRLTREVSDAFEGSELEAYFQQIVPAARLDARTYLAVNLYAHQRFPHNLTFVRNLLSAYRNRETSNPAEWERLIRRRWYAADDLRRTFFGFLKRTGRLEAELASIEAANPDIGSGRWGSFARANPAAAQLWAEGQVWRRRYEDAAPAMLALSTEAPLDQPIADRAISVYRSLAYADPLKGDAAAALAEAAANAAPADRSALARAGDVLADRGLYERAAPFWERMSKTERGDPSAWLEAATVFWDYYLFDDALALLEGGRAELQRPGLFAYEAGAIREAQNDPDGAVSEYLAGALAEERNYPAISRLVLLSRRDGYRERVEQATQSLVAGAEPAVPAIELRLRVLEANEKFEEYATLLSEIAQVTESQALLDVVERNASNRNLLDVRVAVAERRIELTRDPVESMRLRLELVRLHEARGDQQAADGVSQSLYAENSRILGVVRGRVDYLWRNNRRSEAVDELLRAAAAAYPALRDQFTFQAARKAVEAEDFERGREILALLREREPLDARYLAAVADSYARQGLDAELRDFYIESLEAAQSADLPAAERRTLIAQLRRGLIPALDRLGEQPAAVDQYIELVNRFPEDEPLVGEAVRYAEDAGLTDRLEGAYVRTTEQSPRDVRYHRVLAWVRTQVGDYEGALAAVDNALGVQPDSVALWEMKAGHEERLLRFGPARESYRKLWELTYQDPTWMEAVARNDVRLGEPEAAVESVRLAWIEGRPDRPENYFRAARLLEELGLMDEAFQQARRGVVSAGSKLLSMHSDGAGLFLRLAVRLRRHEDAYERVRSSWTAPADELPTWSWQDALGEMLRAADAYLTGDEADVFSAFLDRIREPMGESEFRNALMPAVRLAGPAAAEADWLRASLLASPGGAYADQDRSRLIELERSRMRHAELGRLLEAVWRTHPDPPRNTHILSQAADAYRWGGDYENELRVRDQAGGAGDLERYWSLLLERNPARLVERCGSGGGTGRAAAEFATLAADADLARLCIEAAGRHEKPVWTRAGTASAGLFHLAAEPVFGLAFESALGGGTVGERVGATVDRDRQLAGDLWFAYGAAYGRYLQALSRDGAEDHLPAALEDRPANSAGYFDLAERYLAAGEYERAEADFEHVLELQPDDPRATERLAETAWQAGDRTAALQRWRTALERLDDRRNANVYWEETPALFAKLRERELLDDLAEPVRTLLENHVRRQGLYRLKEFAGAVGVDRFAALADLAPDPVGFLRGLVDVEGQSEAERLRLIDRAIAVAQRRIAAAPPQLARMRTEELWTLRMEKLERLLAAGRTDAARDLASTEGLLDRLAQQKPDLLLRFGAQADRLEEALERLPFVQDHARALAADNLRQQGREQIAQRLLEALHERAIGKRAAVPADYLALAEIRLRQGRPEDAETLIDRLIAAQPEPFSQHVEAAELLERFSRDEKAAELLRQRVQAAPWDYEARLRLARLADQEADLAALADNAEAPAAIRRRASGGAASPDSTEGLLTRLANRPDAPPELRLALFEALASAGRAAQAGEAIRPLLERSGLAYRFDSRESVFNERFEESSPDAWLAEQFLGSLRLSSERRAEVASEIADVLVGLDKFEAALQFARIASLLEPGSDAYRARIESMSEAARIRAENARRRPRLREDLAQPQPVRPKLEAAAR